jgi:hypothetical protein
VAPDIKVTATPDSAGWTCRVRIEEAARTVSEHTVKVSRSDIERFSPASSVEDLVTRSFVFLLEREPPQSILRNFELTDIERYFPDFPRVISA